MNIKDFAKGIITRVHPQLIPSTSSVVYNNCDNEKGILCPTALPLTTGKAVKRAWVHNLPCDSIADSDDVTYWNTFEDKLYAISPNITPLSRVLCDNTLDRVGTLPPTDAVLLTTEAEGNLCGSYSYVYTYYDALSDEESIPSPIGNTATIAIDIDEPGTEEIDNLEERQNFLLMSGYIYTLRNSDLSDAEILDALICAVNKYTWTVDRFVDFTATANTIAANGESDIDRRNAIICLLDSYPESLDIKKAFSAIYKRIGNIVNSEKYDTQQKLDVIACTLTGRLEAVEVYNPRFHELVDLLFDALEADYPDTASSDEPEWRLIQLKCILSETPGAEVEEPEEPEVCGGKIVISNILSSSEPGVVIRLYRLGGDITVYTLVDTLINIGQTYIDNKADSTIAGAHVLDSFSNVLAPTNGYYLTEYNVMLFLAVGTSVVFSDIAKPHGWPPVNELRFTEEITGMGTVQNGLLVFTRYRTYIVVGNSPSTLARYLISDEQGCVNHNTIAFNDNSLFWLSTDGICTSSGGAITILTQDRLGRLDIQDSINAVVFDRMYILSYGEGSIILDHRYDFCIRTISDTGWLGIFNDTLHTSTDGELLELFKGENRVMRYESPIFSEGRLTEYKIFKDLYIAFTGNIALKVYLYTHDRPKELVFDRQLDIQHIQSDIKLKGNLMGYGLQFEITGTGCVQEIDFIGFVGRENGK